MSNDTEVDETYTIDINGKRYALSKEFREAIQNRARGEYRDNPVFSCWWKVANREDYSDEEWEKNNHSNGDPILVIETEGPMVPWDNLDELEVEMQDISKRVDSGDRNEYNSGSGMKSIPKDDADLDEEEEEIKRPFFGLTPRNFEDVPQPKGEDENKLPPKPIEMDDDPALIWWVPNHPEVEERWSAGEAIVPASSWVEWNVQARADEIRFGANGEKKPDSHDHFESLCNLYDCEKVGEYQVSQETPNGESGQVKRKGKEAYENGRFGGGNFHV